MGTIPRPLSSVDRDLLLNGEDGFGGADQEFVFKGDNLRCFGGCSSDEEREEVRGLSLVPFSGSHKVTRISRLDQGRC